MRIGGVVFILADPRHRLLLEQRDDIGDFGPQWFFPAGKRLHREMDHLSTLFREMDEELGVEPAWFEELTLVDRPSLTGERYKIAPYLVTQWFGDLPERTLDQHARPLCWIPAQELIDTHPVPLVRSLAAHALRVLTDRRRSA